ncbi:MAG: hypothetical protein ACFCUQ_17975 [Kiloniellales bacterium]
MRAIEIDWSSFWDLASPDEAARALRGIYGRDAARASAECLLVATTDGRTDDCRFWMAVLAALDYGGEPADRRQTEIRLLPEPS